MSKILKSLCWILLIAVSCYLLFVVGLLALVAYTAYLTAESSTQFIIKFSGITVLAVVVAYTLGCYLLPHGAPQINRSNRGIPNGRS